MLLTKMIGLKDAILIFLGEDSNIWKERHTIRAQVKVLTGNDFDHDTIAGVLRKLNKQKRVETILFNKKQLFKLSNGIKK